MLCLWSTKFMLELHSCNEDSSRGTLLRPGRRSLSWLVHPVASSTARQGLPKPGRFTVLLQGL